MARRSKRMRRTKAEIAAVREAAREELRKGHPMTLRQVHYRLTSRADVIQPNTVSAYDTLSGWLRDDRLAGPVPWEWLEDRLRRPRSWAMWNDPREFLLHMRYRYSRNVWQDQEHFLELWVEKDALSGIFTDVLGHYGVTLNVGRGYDGWSSIKQAADRYRRLAEQSIQTTICYYGDHDPSGEDMHRSLIERLNRLDAYPEVPKIALTHEQALGLPGDVTKADDSMAEAFIAKYGNLAVELDALPVEDLRASIREEVESRMNLAALEANERIEALERADLRDRIDRMYPEEEE